MDNAPSAGPRFAVCVCNDGYPAALELNGTYPMLADPQAEKHGLVRIIDESGEAYLYPEEFFHSENPPASTRDALLRMP